MFKNPRAIRELVSRTIREATPIVQRTVRHGADEVIEEAGVRVLRQSTRTPGKFRYIVEKNFGREIGTRGEKILRIVIDMSGRLVTAFPVDRFMVIGLSLGAVGIFTESTANASERIRARVEAEENKPTDWTGEVLDFLNPLSGGSLNEGEDLTLGIDRIVRDTINAVIHEIEETEQMSLNLEQQDAIGDLVMVAIGHPLAIENMEEE